MKKIRLLIVAWAAGAVAVSCSKTDLRPVPAPGGENDTPVTVSLSSLSRSVSALAFGDANPAVKAVQPLDGGTEDDARIHDLWAIQYDGAGNLVGVPYYTDQIPAATAGATGVSSTYGMKLMLTSSTDAAGKVYLIANTHTPGLFREDNIAAEDDLKAMAQHLAGEYKPEAGTGIPMLGLYTGVVNSTATLGNVEMKRLAAKVVLRLKSSLGGFTVTDVQLKNVASGMYYCPEPASGTDFPALDATAGSGSHIDYPAEDLARAVPDGDYETFTWYVPENLRKATAAVPAAGDRTPDKTDGKATCIEVTGVLREGENCRKGTLRILLGDLGADGKAFDNFDVRRNTVYTVTADIKGLNEGDYRLTVESFDMSNCAMIQPEGTESVTFDIRKLTKGWQTTMPALGEDAELRAELLWTDNAALATQLEIRLDKLNGLLTLKSTGAAEGNAVVALYNSKTAGSGEVLWSWHAWVTGYKPGEAGVATRAANTAYQVAGGQVHTYGTEFQRVNGTSRVIMDRNLGATAALYALSTTNAENYPTYGLFYQWGRKDPFPKAPEGEVVMGSIASQVTYNAAGEAMGFKEKVLGPVSMDVAVKNPETFYYNETPPHDWISTPEDGLWGDGGPKSPYDPCPRGWRVPPIGTWNDLSVGSTFNLNSSWTEMNVEIAGGLYAAGSVRAFYPAAGIRHWSGAALYNVGFSGFSMSSAVDGDNVYLMAFDCNGVNPKSDGHRRARGFAVRCIQYVE